MNDPSGLPWQQPPPSVISLDYGFRTEPLAMGWNRALERQAAPTVTSLDIKRPRTVAIQIPIRQAAVRVRSFQFAEPTEGQGTHLPAQAANPSTDKANI